MNKKKKWIYSLISLCLCVAMLLGTTLAWFTDTVSVKSSAKSGNLGIELLKYEEGKYQPLADGTNIFDSQTEGVQWLPGKTELVYLAVKNTKDLALKYQIVANVTGLSENDTAFQYVIYDGVQGNSETASELNDLKEKKISERWTAMKQVKEAQSGTMKSGEILAAPNGYLETGKTDYFALAVNMDEEAGNEYQGKNVTIDVTVYAVQPDGEMAVSGVLGSSVMLNQDFEQSAGNFTIHSNNNIVARTQDTDGNWYMRMEDTQDSEMHLTAQNLASLSDYVVFDLDFKVFEEGSQMTIYGICENDNTDKSTRTTFAYISADGTFKYADGTMSAEIDAGKWYHFAAAVDYFSGKITYYFEGEKTAVRELPKGVNADNKFAALRFHRTIYGNTSWNVANVEWSDPFAIGLDNLRAYDAKAPLEDLGEIVKEITLKETNVFADETWIVNSLKNYTTVHKRSGVVSVNGEKKILDTAPVKKGEETLIKTAELAQALGVQLPEGTSSEMDIEKFFREVLGKKTVADEAATNAGMVIAGEESYELPKDAEKLQELNDFCMYFRPSAEYLLQEYENSPLNGQHPRIQATAADFAKIRTIYKNKSDQDIYNWALTAINTADSLLEKEPAVYELRDGVRLLYVSREVLDKMYALGMAYQLTGEQKYAERGYKELEAVCKFNDWNPNHGLDVAEMAAAVAIGYDWLYEALTPEQRAVVEKGIYNNAFYDAVIMYQDGNGYMYGGVGDNNWNNVISGGLTLAALAALDVYPEEASRVLEYAVRASDIYLYHYAPNGAWFEGPSYWDYATTYMVKEHSGLEKIFGTDFGLGSAEGLDGAGSYIVNMQGDQGVFTYGDGIVAKIYTPEMFYLAKKYNNPTISTVVLNKTEHKMNSGEHAALAMLWYDPDQTGGAIENLPLDAYYESDAVISMHDSFESGETTFVAYHAGDNTATHGHLDAGSFIFESDGVRWAIELGQGNYNEEGYWDAEDGGKRWNIWRMRAEAHNTLVIDPTQKQDQEVNSKSTITKLVSKDKGAIALSDLTDAYRGSASSVLRGLQFTDNRRSLVIRDELTLKKAGSKVYWFMLTDSEVTVESSADGLTHQAVLTKNGRTMVMDFITDQKAVLSCSTAEPLNSATAFNQKETAKRIALEIDTSSETLNITVKLTPASVVNPSDVKDYDKSMSLWSVADGERPKAPKLDSLVINDVELPIEGYTLASYYVEGTLTEVPEITAKCNDSNIEVTVTKGTLSTETYITLTDKNDAENKTVYTVKFKSVPQPESFPGKTSIPAVSATASITPQPENTAMNVIDGNRVTKWAGNSAGNYITLDIQRVQEISGAAILFQSTVAGRCYDFTVSVSEDGELFKEVYEGTSSELSKESTDWKFDMAQFDQNYKARYIRVTVNGNNQNSEWTSIGEIVIYKNNP